MVEKYLEIKNLRKIAPCDYLEEVAHDGGCYGVGMTFRGEGVGSE
jgi:hypothetical protein